MKIPLLGLVVALALGISAKAQNLIVNGDFETGALTPWTGGSIAADPAGGFQATTSFTLSQTVATTAGKKYYVAGDFLMSLGVSGASITANPTGGGTDGTRGIPFSSSTQRAGLLFTASTGITVIRLNAPTFPGSSMTIDDVVMFEVGPSKLKGRYAGNIVTTVTVPSAQISNKTSRKVSARIDDDGRIIILDGTQAIYTGTIINNGAFDLALGLSGGAGGTAKIRGGRIQLDFNSTSLLATDANGMLIPNTASNRIILTKR